MSEVTLTLAIATLSLALPLFRWFVGGTRRPTVSASPPEWLTVLESFLPASLATTSGCCASPTVSSNAVAPDSLICIGRNAGQAVSVSARLQHFWCCIAAIGAGAKRGVERVDPAAQAAHENGSCCGSCAAAGTVELA